MSEIYYKKVGRRYVQVGEYNSEIMDSYPPGATLVISTPGSTMKKYNIDPNFAAMIAAGQVATKAICSAMIDASQLQPSKPAITPGQKLAWENLAKEFGVDLFTLHGASTQDIAEAGVKAMQDEAMKMLKNPAVKKAYDHFMLVYKLTKETNESES